MTDQVNRHELRNRYLFKGYLTMQTALHIGTARGSLSSSDSPVVITPENVPFIPGSTFKGALRSTVEKLVLSLPSTAGLRSCGLIELNEEAYLNAEKDGRIICPTIRQWNIVQEKRNNPEMVREILNQALRELCHTCRLFGSPFAASRITVRDLYMPREEWHGIIQIRDGISIDRDSGKAKDRLKYDFEVVPAGSVFNLEIMLENATLQDLQLLCIGLSEFVHGFGGIGGKRSRGLGACQLENLEIFVLELAEVGESERTLRLRNYLLRREFSSRASGQDFLEKYISSIFQ